MCPPTLLQMLAQPRCMSSISSILQPAKHVTLFMRHHAIESKIIRRFFLYHVGTEELHLSKLRRQQCFRSLNWIQWSPPCPQYQFDTNINVKNRTCQRAINLRSFSFAQHPILKFWGQGDTHRVKMKFKASSQTTDAVVAELSCLWDTWTCHSLSNIEVCANASGNISKHQPAGKRFKKSTLAAVL